MANFFPDIIDYSINRPKTFSKVNGELVYSGRPSSFWEEHDQSIKEIGVILYWGNNKCYYRKNLNPNVNKKRILQKEELEKIIGIKLSH